MKIRKAIIAITIGLVICIGGCSSFFEEDLSIYRVKILAPADGISTVGDNITFWWDYVNGATNYEFQLVNPKFDNVYRVVQDSILSGNKIIVDLDPGTYQWRVRAYNESSSSPFSIQNIFIIQAEPDNEIITNQ